MARPGKQPDRTVPMTHGSYLVVGTHTVFGVKPGELVSKPMTLPVFHALVEAGHLDPNPVAAEESAAVTAQAEQPVVIHVTDGDNVQAADSNI